jgi:hypothetical protein
MTKWKPCTRKQLLHHAWISWRHYGKLQKTSVMIAARWLIKISVNIIAVTLLKYSGYCMFHVKKLCISLTECIYVFQVILRRNRVHILNSINQLVSVMEMQCVFREVGCKLPSIIYVNLRVQRVK